MTLLYKKKDYRSLEIMQKSSCYFSYDTLYQTKHHRLLEAIPKISFLLIFLIWNFFFIQKRTIGCLRLYLNLHFFFTSHLCIKNKKSTRGHRKLGPNLHFFIFDMTLFYLKKHYRLLEVMPKSSFFYFLILSSLYSKSTIGCLE